MVMESLKAFGLTDKEINIYLSTLKLGEATAHKIAKLAQTNRPYCYEVLASLQKQGLVTTNIKNNTKYYHSINPDKIKDLMKEKEQQVLKSIPQLKEMFQSIGNLPKAEIFEGIEGIKTILNDIVKTKKTVYIYSSAEKQAKLLEHHFPQYIKRRAEAKVKAKVIVEKSQYSKELKKRDKSEYRELRFFPKPMPFATATHIYGNKTAIFSLEGTYFGIIIENEQISKTQKFIFDLMWDKATLR